MSFVDYSASAQTTVTRQYACPRCGHAWERTAKGGAIVNEAGTHRTDRTALQEQALASAKLNAEAKLADWGHALCERCLFPGKPNLGTSWPECMKAHVHPPTGGLVFGCAIALLVLWLLGAVILIAAAWRGTGLDPLSAMTFGLLGEGNDNKGALAIFSGLFWLPIIGIVGSVLAMRRDRADERVVTESAMSELLASLPPVGLHLFVLDVYAPPWNPAPALLRWCTSGFPFSVGAPLLERISKLTNPRVTFPDVEACIRFLAETNHGGRPPGYDRPCPGCGRPTSVISAHWIGQQLVCEQCARQSETRA